MPGNGRSSPSACTSTWRNGGTSRAGVWSLNYQVVRRDSEIEGEVNAQLDAFRRQLGREPTHLDSHHHVHLTEPTATVMSGLAAELGVPLRRMSARLRYCGS